MPSTFHAIPEAPGGGFLLEDFNTQAGDKRNFPLALAEAFTDENVVRAVSKIVQGAIRAEFWRGARPLHALSDAALDDKSIDLASLSLSQSVGTDFGSTSYQSEQNPIPKHQVGSDVTDLGVIAEASEKSYLRVPTDVAYEVSGPTHVVPFDSIDEGGSDGQRSADLETLSTSANNESILNHHPRRFETFKELQFERRKQKGSTSLEFGATLSLSDLVHKLTSAERTEAEWTRRNSKAALSFILGDTVKGSRRILWQLYSTMKHFVRSGWIDYCSACCILLNAATLGWQADHMAVNVTEEETPALRACEVCFCILFTIELLLRIMVYRCRFFSLRYAGWQWNYFDMLVVSLQILEEVITAVSVALQSGSSSNFAGNFGMMRILRLLRLVRIMRLLRVLHLIGELRTLVVSLSGCARSLAWTLVLVFLTIYIVSIFILQSVIAAIVEDPSNTEFDPIRDYFDSLPKALLTLYQFITGGLSWGAVVVALNDNVSPMVTVVLLFYVSFSVLALFNIVTGVFVENALLTAKKDKDLYMLHHVCELFKKGDSKGEGHLSKEDFIKLLAEKEMQSLLKDIGLAPDEVLSLFEIIDVNGDSQISPDEFLNGCLRVRGEARAYEQAMLAHELKRQERTAEVKSKRLTRSISKMSSQMNLLMIQMNNLESRWSAQAPQAKVLHASLAARLLNKPRG